MEKKVRNEIRKEGRGGADGARRRRHGEASRAGRERGGRAIERRGATRGATRRDATRTAFFARRRGLRGDDGNEGNDVEKCERARGRHIAEARDARRATGVRESAAGAGVECARVRPRSGECGGGGGGGAKRQPRNYQHVQWCTGGRAGRPRILPPRADLSRPDSSTSPTRILASVSPPRPGMLPAATRPREGNPRARHLFFTHPTVSTFDRKAFQLDTNFHRFDRTLRRH